MFRPFAPATAPSRRRTLPGAVALLIAAAGCSSDTLAAPAAPNPSTASVAAVGLTWSPATVTIAPGGTVTFQLGGNHTVAFSGAGAPAGLPLGTGTATVTFPAAGSYPYACTVHANMTGTVVVN